MVWDQVWSQISRGDRERPDEEVFTRSLLDDELCDEASVVDIASRCGREAERLLYREEALSALSAMERLGVSSSRLDEPLDELRLRPVLLRTRCSLCPA